MQNKGNYLHISKRTVILLLAAIGLLVTGAASSYMAKYDAPVASKPVPAPKKVAQHTQAAAPRQQMAQAKPRCNDGNIVGTVGGGIAGGVVGNQVGKGAGNTAATIAGTLGGAYLGNKYIPTQGVTCE